VLLVSGDPTAKCGWHSPGRQHRAPVDDVIACRLPAPQTEIGIFNEVTRDRISIDVASEILDYFKKLFRLSLRAYCIFDYSYSPPTANRINKKA